MITSYRKIRNLGHEDVEGILDLEVDVEEKLDGSQLSFGVFNGGLQFRSKEKCELSGLFSPAVFYVASIQHKLEPNWTYRVEYIGPNSWNVLKYSRLPQNNMVLLDVKDHAGDYITHGEKEIVARSLGIECVRLMATGVVSIDDLDQMLKGESQLGGCFIEGVVIKPIKRGRYIAKYVNKIHQERTKKPAATVKNIITELSEAYTTEARWQKALQHCQENGQLTGDKSDLGVIIKEVHRDVLEEYGDEIKQVLFDWAWPQLRNNITKGLPNWHRGWR